MPVPLSPRSRMVASLAAVLKATSRASRIFGSSVCRSTSGTTARTCSSSSSTCDCNRRIRAIRSEHDAKLVGRERLGQIIERPAPHRLDRRLDRGVGRDDHHVQPGGQGQQPRQAGPSPAPGPAAGPAAPSRTAGARAAPGPGRRRGPRRPDARALPATSAACAAGWRRRQSPGYSCHSRPKTSRLAAGRRAICTTDRARCKTSGVDPLRGPFYTSSFRHTSSAFRPVSARRVRRKQCRFDAASRAEGDSRGGNHVPACME